MSSRIGKLNSALPELLIGIAAAGILFEVVGIWFVKDKSGYGIGVLIGIVIAATMAVHMAKTLDVAVDMNRAGAEKKILLGSVLRYLLIIIILVVVFLTEIANPLAVFLGIMSLKVAAYSQPFTHRIMLKVLRKEN